MGLRLHSKFQFSKKYYCAIRKNALESGAINTTVISFNALESVAINTTAISLNSLESVAVNTTAIISLNSLES